MRAIQKILVIGYVWPEPRSSAAGSRMLKLLQLLRAEAWQVVFASAAALSPHRADLSALGIEEKPIELNADSFDHFIQAYQPDVVLFDRFFTEEQFAWRVEQHCPHALRVLETVDLHCLREARHRLLKQQQAACQDEAARRDCPAVQADAAQLFASMADDDVAKREIAAIYRSDLSLMMSHVEIDLLYRYFSVPMRLLMHSDAIDTPAISSMPARLGFAARQDFLSIGNFRHAPNWDAVLWLQQAIWPRIHRALPAARLLIAGSYPPPKAQALHQPKAGVWVLGWVDDALHSMAQARVCLAPLRFGAGIKGKLVDAMASGTPSVTTSIGAESMAGDHAWGGAIADHGAQFAEAAIRLYQNESEWQQAQAAGDQIYQHYWDQPARQHDFTKKLRQLHQDLAYHRRQNFTGAMLRHHSHQSTHYLARWIAEKNRHVQQPEQPDHADKLVGS